jgi:hypothetical protein
MVAGRSLSKQCTTGTRKPPWWPHCRDSHQLGMFVEHSAYSYPDLLTSDVPKCFNILPLRHQRLQGDRKEGVL